MTRFWLCAIVAIGVLSSAKAHAQYTNPFTGNSWNNPMSSLADTMLLHSVQRKLLQQSVDAQNGKKAPATATHQPMTVTDFTPTPGHPTVAAFLDRANLPADQRAALQQVIDMTFAEVEKRMRKDNLATGLGVAIAAAIQVRSGKQIPDDKVKELIAGINDVLAASPELKKIKAGNMQAMYDSLVLTTAVMLVYYELSKKNPALHKAGVDFASTVLATLTGSR